MSLEDRIKAILIQRFKRAAESVLRYLSYRRDPNVKDNFGTTLLHMVASASLDNLAIVQYLVELGANINLQDNYNLTPLHLAIMHNNYKIADFLITEGAAVNIQDSNGNTALHILIDDMWLLKLRGEREKVEKSLGLVRQLLQRGADTNLPDINGETSLMRAARQNDLILVKELLMFGANVHLRNLESATCLHLLLRSYEPDKGILLELIKHGACVNCFDSYGYSIMDYILCNSPEEGLETAKFLIKTATLVNWENKSWFDLKTNLEFTCLEEFNDSCYAEASKMKSCTYSDKSNLCHFALNGGNASQTDKSSGESIFDEVLETLMKNSFPIYDDYIRGHFDRTFLLEKLLRMNVYARNKHQEKSIHLYSHVIFEIASYLEDKDLYNLVRAYPTPDVPRIRNDKITQVAN